MVYEMRLLEYEIKNLFEMKYLHTKMLELKSQKTVIRSAGPGWGQEVNENTGILRVLASFGLCCLLSGLLILLFIVV